MLFLAASLFALAATLAVLAITQAAPAHSRVVSRRLAELQDFGRPARETAERRRRQERRQQLEGLLRRLGNGLERRRQDAVAVKRLLVHAGYRSPSAVSIYWGVRLALALTLAISALAFGSAAGARLEQIASATLGGGILGWIAPAFYVGRRRRRRMHEIQRALPDTLDLLVVCVEAGLALNQALVRVAEETRHVSRAMSDDLTLVNLEIRAGVERATALRNLAERTGVDDVRALTAVLVQTDRFGTSVATTLRTQSEAMRTKRRQRAEEAAAKTTVKLVPPLVLCIFPAIFAVVLGPAAIQILKFLSELK